MIITVTMPPGNERENFIDLLLLSGWERTKNPNEFIFYSKDMHGC